MASQARKESNRLLRRWCADVQGAVLSVGAGDDLDHEGGKYRDYFSQAESYTTSEFGPSGCDLELDICNVGKGLGTWDAIFCSGVLEHVVDPNAALKGIKKLLRGPKLLLLGVPFNQQIHRAPDDFWRWTAHGIVLLLEQHRFAVDDLVAIGDQPAHPLTYWIRAHVA